MQVLQVPHLPSLSCWCCNPPEADANREEESPWVRAEEETRSLLMKILAGQTALHPADSVEMKLFVRDARPCLML